MIERPSAAEISRQIYDFLDDLGISYRVVTHAAAATMEDCAEVSLRLGATEVKNFFLTSKSRKHICLCIARPNARLRTSDLSKQAGTPRLSFADADMMWDALRTYPGAASPMGLIFDSEKKVRLLVDSALKDADELGFHPCDNTQSLALSTADFFEKFLPATGHFPEFVEIHDFAEE